MTALTITIQDLQQAYDKNPLFENAKPALADCIIVQALIGEHVFCTNRYIETVEDAIYFCRVDFLDGGLMVEGWCLFNGERYYKDEASAETYVKECGYRDLEHADDETLGTQWCEWWSGREFSAKITALEAAVAAVA